MLGKKYLRIECPTFGEIRAATRLVPDDSSCYHGSCCCDKSSRVVGVSSAAFLCRRRGIFVRYFRRLRSDKLRFV